MTDPEFIDLVRLAVLIFAVAVAIYLGVGVYALWRVLGPMKVPDPPAVPPAPIVPMPSRRQWNPPPSTPETTVIPNYIKPGR